MTNRCIVQCSGLALTASRSGDARLSFRGGTPAAGFYKATAATRPAAVAEQFAVARIFGFD